MRTEAIRQPLAAVLVAVWVAALMGLAGCGVRPARPAPESAEGTGTILARSERLLIYEAARNERFADIAQRFLGAADLDWVIETHNPGLTQAEAGQPVVVPLQPPSPAGVTSRRYQTVPVLCYHRFAAPGTKTGAQGKMTVSATDFGEQLGWLSRHGWRVLRLSELEAWLHGRKALPPRSVVITADDGYASFYRHAFPLLKKHGFPATLFVYTDFIGAGDAVDWQELKEMADTGLVDVQAHSRTHRNLTDWPAGEPPSRYLQMVDSETRGPRELLARRLGVAQRHFAYPYGDANQTVLDSLASQGVTLGLTVHPGGNPFFAQALMLRRTMIYGDMDLDAFKARLQISRPFGSR